jgi:hypothetical protein
MQRAVTLELEKKQGCSKVAYDIMGNLLEDNTKQYASRGFEAFFKKNTI